LEIFLESDKKERQLHVKIKKNFEFEAIKNSQNELNHFASF
jgi:hypothetical protein